MSAIFHLALHVTHLETAIAFYQDLLGCRQGRRTETWIDFDFFGHQLSLHLGQPMTTEATGCVAGINVPIPHFGVIVAIETWQAVADRLESANVAFTNAPTLRFEGQPGEQRTLFFNDPFGNPIEIKGFSDLSGVFDQ